MDILLKIIPWVLGIAAFVALLCASYVKAPPIPPTSFPAS